MRRVWEGGNVVRLLVAGFVGIRCSTLDYLRLSIDSRRNIEIALFDPVACLGGMVIPDNEILHVEMLSVGRIISVGDDE